MNATVMTYQGEQDGLRFGDLRFSDGTQRHFLLDRIGRKLRLWSEAGSIHGMSLDDRQGREDLDPDRLAAALTAMRGRS